MRDDYAAVIRPLVPRSTPGTRRLVLRARALVASDDLALRLAASAVLLSGLALVVWWSVGLVTAL